MEFRELLKRRRMVRHYERKPVPRETERARRSSGRFRSGTWTAARRRALDELVHWNSW